MVSDDTRVSIVPSEWADDNPFFLLIALEAGHKVVDLGEPDWSVKYADWLRVKSVWLLCDKSGGQVRLMINVTEGDQPYYVKRHFGQVQTDGGRGRRTAIWGIGKKAEDGTMTRLWIMPDGVAVSGGDDDAVLARMVLETLDWVDEPPG